MNTLFPNDNISVYVPEHELQNLYQGRAHHEVIFRRIHTYMIENNILKDNFIDLGAWIGDNTIPWAKKISGTIYAIDPSPYNCAWIDLISHSNGLENVKIIITAISEAVQELRTNENEMLFHCSFVYDTNSQGSTRVLSVSLDHLHDIGLITNIGYIHLDVEGMEYQVLRGGGTLIDKYRPIITFEQHLELDDVPKTVQFLQDRGYNVYMIDEVLPGCRLDCRNFLAFPYQKPDMGQFESVLIEMEKK
jgi:FkbM family methyltransferase